MNQKAASNLSQIINPVGWDFENLDSESEIIKALSVVKSPDKSLPSDASHKQGHVTKVNEFFPDGCETTPVNPVLQSSSSRSVAHILPSPRLKLEPVVVTECDEVFDHQEKSSEEVFDHENDTPEDLRSAADTADSYREETNQYYTPKMEADTYKEKLLQIRSEVDKVDRKWQAYTKDDVEVVIDMSECLAKLQKVEDAEELCQNKIFDMIYELDENVEADGVRIKSLRSMSDDLRKRVKTNSKEVKVKMADILRK